MGEKKAKHVSTRQSPSLKNASRKRKRRLLRKRRTKLLPRRKLTCAAVFPRKHLLVRLRQMKPSGGKGKASHISLQYLPQIRRQSPACTSANTLKESSGMRAARIWLWTSAPNWI